MGAKLDARLPPATAKSDAVFRMWEAWRHLDETTRDARRAYLAAVNDAYAELGASELARQTGWARSRIYQLLKQFEEMQP